MAESKIEGYSISLRPMRIADLPSIHLGWKPTCNCNVEPEPPIILDPFSGSGTTGVVAKETGRRAILIDTSEKYYNMSKVRIRQATNPSIPMELSI